MPAANENKNAPPGGAPPDVETGEETKAVAGGDPSATSPADAPWATRNRTKILARAALVAVVLAVALGVAFGTSGGGGGGGGDGDGAATARGT